MHVSKPATDQRSGLDGLFELDRRQLLSELRYSHVFCNTDILLLIQGGPEHITSKTANST